jgi:LDH2 family malate/lactate/ureidoglycolate dehydrogenase
MPAAAFHTRMDAVLRMLKSSPAAPGVDRVLVPGEIELANEHRFRRDGIPMPDTIRSQLMHLGSELGVTFPEPLTRAVDPESTPA